MALVGLIGSEAPAADAARLHELNISALAFAEAARRTLNGPERRYLAAKAERLRRMAN